MLYYYQNTQKQGPRRRIGLFSPTFTLSAEVLFALNNTSEQNMYKEIENKPPETAYFTEIIHFFYDIPTKTRPNHHKHTVEKWKNRLSLSLVYYVLLQRRQSCLKCLPMWCTLCRSTTDKQHKVNSSPNRHCLATVTTLQLIVGELSSGILSIKKILHPTALKVPG